MRLYDETCVALCEGQYLDIWMAGHDEGLSVELYFDMIGRKTAALIAASIEAGAVLATEDEDVIARYRAFGWDLGIAFQLNDDLLGIWGPEVATGKEPTDVPRKKKTLPVIYAFEHATPEDRARLSALYANGSLGGEHVTEIVDDPRADRRPRVHARPGPPPPRPRARRARRGGHDRARAAGTPRGDHQLGDQRLGERWLDASPTRAGRDRCRRG